MMSTYTVGSDTLGLVYNVMIFVFLIVIVAIDKWRAGSNMSTYTFSRAGSARGIPCHESRRTTVTHGGPSYLLKGDIMKKNKKESNYNVCYFEGNRCSARLAAKSAGNSLPSIEGTTTTPVPSPGSQGRGIIGDLRQLIVCPICQKNELVDTDDNGRLSCERCQRSFGASVGVGSIDLTLSGGLPSPRAYERTPPPGIQIFRNPLVSLAYERGWRQSFSWAGFPGLDEESKLAMDVLKPAYGDVLVDMSCGSGLFSRKFIESGKFKRVIAADYSETMVQEARSNFERARLDPARGYLLLRADVCRLPFATGSIPAIHAGAAIHCWPDPLGAMAEISRVLRPGGIFVGTTFLSAVSPLEELVGNDVIRPVRAVIDQSPLGSSSSSNIRWWNEDELRDLSETASAEAAARIVEDVCADKVASTVVKISAACSDGLPMATTHGTVLWASVKYSSRICFNVAPPESSLQTRTNLCLRNFCAFPEWGKISLASISTEGKELVQLIQTSISASSFVNEIWE
eukprot:jgi/Picsp_1/939/NSC_04424-R1_protein